MEFCRTEQDDKGNWIIDSDQTVRLKANYVISAFGSGLYESDGKYINNKLKRISLFIK